jgi:hypothetical protein
MRILIALALLALPALAAAQTPAHPGSKLAFEIDPGRMASGSTTVPRPEANVAFDLRIDGGTAVAAVKDGACVVQTAPVLTCRVLLPTLAEGPHTVEIRGRATPAEPGVSPGPYSAPFALAMVVVVPPGAPATVRVVTP